jgi:hypothetical protein
VRKFLQAEGWAWQPDCGYVPPGVCFGGSEGSSQQSSQQTSQSLNASQSATNPINMQNPAFTSLAPQTATQLAAITNLLGGGAGFGGSIGEALSALGFQTNGSAFTGFNPATPGNTSNNPFVAPVTGAQNDTLAQLGAASTGNFGSFDPNLAAIMGQLQGEATNPTGFAAGVANAMPTDPTLAAQAANPVGVGQAFANGLPINPTLAAEAANPVATGQQFASGLPINATLQQEMQPGFASSLANGMPVDPSIARMLDPNYAGDLANNSTTQGIIQEAIAPGRAFFNSQTVPGITQTFAQAGQRAGGSSAFDMSFGNALAAESANEQGIASGIANAAYQTGIQGNQNASQLVQGERAGLYGQGATETANAGTLVQGEQAGAYNAGTTAGVNAAQTIQGEQAGAYGQGTAAGENAATLLQGERAGAYGTGLNLAGSAAGQYSQLGSQEIQELMGTLQSEALPQLTQQLGINNAMSTFQQSVSAILQSLGLQTQAEQPDIAYESGSQSLGESTSQGTSQGSSQSLGFNFGALLP